MSEVFSVLLHNRQRYEQGKEGLWFSLPTTTEKLQAALREIGISTDNPQDFFLYGYRSPQKRPIKLPRDMVLSAGMDELNFLAARLEKLDAAELMELNAALTSPQSDFHNIGQIIDYPENVDFYVHLPDVTGTGQLGDYYLNRSGMVDMPEEWKAGIFLPRFGLHIANTEHGVFTDYGYLVKSGDEWQRVHEGQPVPEEYRVMAYPAPEILREESKVQPEAAAPTKAPQPVTPILLNGQNSAERMKEITDRLETGIQELFESERYKAYLTTMSKFHSYSFNNTLLIAMQGGQLVAGYNKWRDNFHRNVKKGEKAIKILAPAPFKAKKEVQKLDAQGRPVMGKDGKPVTEVQEIQVPDVYKRQFLIMVVVGIYAVRIQHIGTADDTAPEPARELPEITEGQTFDKVTAAVTEHFTAPPKSYTEDTLLSAMELSLIHILDTKALLNCMKKKNSWHRNLRPFSQSKLPNKIVSVSYTHLDVYKRQPLCGGLSKRP